MFSEKDLIELFKDIGSKYASKNGVTIGPGDDCASFNCSGKVFTSIDSSIENVHFPDNADASDIAYRSVAVALSDIAAMGCKPIAYSVSLTSKNKDIDWYKSFARGLCEISDLYEIPLIGGDLTKNILNINVVVYGKPFKDKFLTRKGAQVGDSIFISSQVGQAAKGLQDWKSNKFDSEYIKYYMRPKAKIELGEEIVKHASSCIDTSDGLLNDLSHLLEESKVGADIDLDSIPVTNDIDDIILGDDYDLCFTMPNKLADKKYFKIGEVKKGKKINLKSNKGLSLKKYLGYDHFKII